jgi:hypothetical protein
MIWGHTWPGPQVIEPTLLDEIAQSEEAEEDESIELASRIDETSELDDSEEEVPRDIACLRPRFSLATHLNNEHVESNTLVALYVCQESRRHTLSVYQRMEHAKYPDESFYFNPYRDVIFFSFDFIWDCEEEDYFSDLEKYYGDQLSFIKTALVEGQILWCEGPAWYSDCLRSLGGLKNILVLQIEELEEEDSQMQVDESSEDGYDEEIQIENSGARERTKDIQAKYAEYWKHERAMQPKIVCIDHSGKIF